MPNVFEHCRVVTIMGEANLLPPPPASLGLERLAASFAVGDGDDFLYPSSPPLLTASFVRGTAFMLECLMILRWLVKAELTFQIVEHHFLFDWL